MTQNICILLFVSGFLASFFVGTIMRLQYDQSKHENAVKRSIFRTLTINSVIMLVAIVHYLTVYVCAFSEQVLSGWLARAIGFDASNYLCLFSFSSYTCIAYTLAYVRPVNMRHWVLTQLPIAICLLAYIATGGQWCNVGCQIYTVVGCVVSYIIVLQRARRYEIVIRQTYSDITQRGITWAVSFAFPALITFLLWCYAVSQNHPLLVALTECCILALNAYFVFRVELQNYQMEEVTEEAIAEEAALAEPMPAEEVAEPVAETLEKKKQSIHLDPLLSKQIEHYCIEQRAFTNPDLSVNDVAKVVGSNRYYVSRWFNEQGCNFNTYINNLRVREAEALLRTTYKSLEEIAISVGFNSTHTFARVFRNIRACTPKQFREKWYREKQ